MSIVKIVTTPDPVLVTKCAKSKPGSEETKILVDNLNDTLNDAKNPQGAGLAAPQIGVLKRVLVARNFFENPANPGNTIFENIVFINPKIISHSTDTDLDWEGCLSIPDVYGKVVRYKTIKVRTENIDGGEYQIKASGFFARVIQHEMDHLDGVLFTSKIVGETLTEAELDDIIEHEEVMRA